MKILFVFTGGTIGSTLQKDNVISTDADKSYKIIKAYSDEFDIDFDYDVAEPYTELSENNTGDHIRMLAQCVKSNLDEGYDGIIVTHGTDTLQYSAAALGYMVGVKSIPICLVASNKPIEDPDSNALCNLHSAVSFIKNREGNGVFVLYRNDNGADVRVHRATRLIGTKTFSDDVSSIFREIYGSFNTDFKFIKNSGFAEKADETETLDPTVISERSDGILVVYPYPGMTYPKLDDGVKYIILNTYHSGTINTRSESARDFFAEAKKKGINVYIVGVTDGPEYESAGLFGEFGIVPLRNISPIAAYVKLWILSQTVGVDEKKLAASLSGDIVP